MKIYTTISALLLGLSATPALAQATSDYTCWADMGDGAGIVDMSYMCGVSPSAPSISLPSPQSTTVDVGTESLPLPRMSRGRISGVSACVSRLTSEIIADPDVRYVEGTLDRLTAECAESEVQELSRIPTSGAPIEVVRARSDRSIWVRLPGEATDYGYGPFDSAQDAIAWANTRIY
ncbi:MAG: hypothetical protein AAFX78_03325 [Cyanobacteria bacterium J06638_20]